MKILITGAEGFIGKNLQVRLAELGDHEIFKFINDSNLNDLNIMVNDVDFIFHLAGVNRPKSISDFKVGNTDLTIRLCHAVENAKRNIPIVFSSSTQASIDNPYGLSKANAESALLEFGAKTKNSIFIYRLTNVFGKWSRPNYNSAVATFCHNIARELPITVNNPDAHLKLIYIDDVIDSFLSLLECHTSINEIYQNITPEYDTTVGELANILYGFKDSIQTGVTLPVGTGLIRALYSTYLSFLPAEKFSYSLTRHEDARGVFVEMLKTSNCGQFSFFTAHPGVTRGGHYHHTKTEKFLVIKGTALYKFRHILTDEYYELLVSDQDTKVVETIPGWSHDITNIGQDELIVMLWANEIFDRNRPDTIGFRV